MEIDKLRQQELKESAKKYVIPHFAHNEELFNNPKIFTRGEGCYVYDMDGKRYFDSFATLLTTVCGHNRPEVTEAVRRQMELLEFFPNYVDSFTVPLVELAEKLAVIMPGGLEVSFFVNSGSEANETALKMARQYQRQVGEKQRYKFIYRKDSYHATTLGGSSVTGLPWFREYFEPLLPGCVAVSAARKRDVPAYMTEDAYCARLLAELESTIRFEGVDLIAGMIMDPLPGSNSGYPLPPAGYLAGVREICDRYGIVLIFDEVQSGFGKTGKWFFCEHEEIYPDIMTIGKGFTGGFIPLGATVTTQKIASVFRQGEGSEFRSGSTYGGHTVACAATLANIDIIESENLLENARKQGELLNAMLCGLAREFPEIVEISGLGLLQAFYFDSTLPDLGKKLRDWCYEQGIILRNNGNIVVLAPSLIVTQEEITTFVQTLKQGMTEILRK